MAPLPEQPTLADFQAAVARLTRKRDWDQRPLSEIFLLFTEEMGELAKEVRYHEGIQRDANHTDLDLKGEFADVFVILLDLANRTDIDLGEAFRKKMAITEKRRWDG